MRRKGPLSSATSILLSLVGIGIFVAVLRMFGGDVIAVLIFIWDKALEFVFRIADAVGDMPLFRSLFQ